MPLHLLFQCFIVGIVSRVVHAAIGEIHLLYFFLEFRLHVILIVRLGLLQRHLVEHLALCGLLLEEVSHGHIVVLHLDKVVFGAIRLNPNVPVVVNCFVLAPDESVLVPVAFDQLQFDEKDPYLRCISDLFIDRVHLHVDGNPVCKITHYLCNDTSLIGRRAVCDSHIFDLLVELGLCSTLFCCFSDNFPKLVFFLAIVAPVVLVEVILST